jgi:hypothetical protein
MAMSEQELAHWNEARQALWASRPWLHSRTLESLAEVNEQCLALLSAEAAHESAAAPPLIREIRPLLQGLDAAARQRAARCPWLLLDAGFARESRWAGAHERRIRDCERSAPAAAYFRAGCTVPVMRLVLTYAWHLARSESAAARLLLGMSARCAELIGACTLSQVTELAETQQHWLRPRWPDYPCAWRELLGAASAGDPALLERALIRGVQRLAGETRAVHEAP